MGIIYNDVSRPSLQQQVERQWGKVKPKSAAELMDTFQL